MLIKQNLKVDNDYFYCHYATVLINKKALSLTHRIDNVIHHLRNKMRRERFCKIKGIQYYGCAYKSEIITHFKHKIKLLLNLII